MPGNGNTAFSVSLFDILYPKSTQWPKPAEPGGRQPKILRREFRRSEGLSVAAQRHRATSEISKSASEGSFPHRYRSHHLKANAFTPTKPFWLLWDVGGKKPHCTEREIGCVLTKVREKERMMLTQRIWSCGSGRCKEIPLWCLRTVSDTFLTPAGKKHRRSEYTLLWLFLALAVTVASGERSFYLFIVLNLIKTFIRVTGEAASPGVSFEGRVRKSLRICSLWSDMQRPELVGSSCDHYL